MIAVVASTAGTKAMWYLTRGSGLVALLLLTATVVVGVLEWRRWAPTGWPRFVVDALHRNLAVLALAFLALHVITSILDGFAPIALLDVVIPFTGSYRPFWLGLGAIALDLMIAVAITSWARQRIGYRAWRAVHWLSYASWPVALMHSVGTGTDTKTLWMLGLSALCLMSVLIAVVVRTLEGLRESTPARGAVLAACVVGPLALILWMPSGPLGRGWARRAGTPASLLGPSAAAASTASRVQVSTPVATSVDQPYRGVVSGTITQGTDPNPGRVTIKLSLRLADASHRRLNLTLNGQPLSSGGLSLSSSSVTLGTPSRADVYAGQVTALVNAEIRATVHRADGRALAMDLIVQTDPSSTAVRGTLAIAPTTVSGA